MSDAYLNTDSLKGLSERVARFCEEREWGQFHNTKDLAISLVLEATEVLEITQWKDLAELEPTDAEIASRLGEELSDVLYWVLLLSRRHRIDLGFSFEAKMLKNEEKYPVAKSRGSRVKYSQL